MVDATYSKVRSTVFLYLISNLLRVSVNESDEYQNA